MPSTRNYSKLLCRASPTDAKRHISSTVDSPMALCGAILKLNSWHHEDKPVCETCAKYFKESYK